MLHFLHCYVLRLSKKVDRNMLGLVKNQGNLDHVSLRAGKSRKILHHSQNWAMKLFCCQVRTNACQISSQSVPTHLPLQIPTYQFSRVTQVGLKWTLFSLHPLIGCETVSKSNSCLWPLFSQHLELIWISYSLSKRRLLKLLSDNTGLPNYVDYEYKMVCNFWARSLVSF